MDISSLALKPSFGGQLQGQKAATVFYIPFPLSELMLCPLMTTATSFQSVNTPMNAFSLLANVTLRNSILVSNQFYLTARGSWFETTQWQFCVASACSPRVWVGLSGYAGFHPQSKDLLWGLIGDYTFPVGMWEWVVVCLHVSPAIDRRPVQVVSRHSPQCSHGLTAARLNQSSF